MTYIKVVLTVIAVELFIIIDQFSHLLHRI